MISEPTKHPLVAVVIPNRNGSAFLKRNMPFLAATDYPNFQAVLADNASTDDSVELIRKNFAFCNLITAKDDRGFAGNVNRGLRWALARRANYIAVVSNDVTVPPAWLSSAVRALEDNPDVGILGFTEVADPSQLTMPGHIEVTPTVYPWGCAFVLRADVVRKVGLYDETLYMYGEEQDYYPRVLRAGFTLATTTIPIFHQLRGYSQSISKRAVGLCYRNAIYCAIKNFGIATGLIVSAKMFCYAVLPDILLKPLRATSLADLANQATLSLRSPDTVDTTGLLRAHSPAFRFWSFLLAVTWNIFHLPSTFTRRSCTLELANE